MKRNPEAMCATCPYWERDCGYGVTSGLCQRYPKHRVTDAQDWCGAHPDFALPEAICEEVGCGQPATQGYSGAEGWVLVCERHYREAFGHDH